MMLIVMPEKVVITYKVKVTSENDVITNKATAGHKGTADFGSTEIEVYEVILH